MTIPHPIPYQGSKRRLAAHILDRAPKSAIRWFEPFAGSAAVSLAAAHLDRADSYHLGDMLVPLVELWQWILDKPDTLANNYAVLWNAQHTDPVQYYLDVRRDFNANPDPVRLLYLLARCVKNAVRFNAEGHFNQSADHRRKGRRPELMRRHILNASALLSPKTQVAAQDYATALADATPDDFVYLDPPYMGTSTRGRDSRYIQPLDRARFVKVLEELRDRDVPFIVSFDGRHGQQRYGPGLPNWLAHEEIHAGRSSQATLNGQCVQTYESLYFSPRLRPA